MNRFSRLFLLVFVWVPMLNGCKQATSPSRNSGTSSAPYFRIAPLIDLHVVPNDSTTDIYTRVQNLSNRTQTIRKIITSCPCVTAAVRTEEMEPDETCYLRITLDLTHSGDARGEVAYTVDAFGPAHEQLFRVTLHAILVPASELPLRTGARPRLLPEKESK